MTAAPRVSLECGVKNCAATWRSPVGTRITASLYNFQNEMFPFVWQAKRQTERDDVCWVSLLFLLCWLLAVSVAAGAFKKKRHYYSSSFMPLSCVCAVFFPGGARYGLLVRALSRDFCRKNLVMDDINV